MKELLQSTVSMAAIGLVAVAVAMRLNFFKWRPFEPDVKIKGIVVVEIFLIYLLMSVFGPLLIMMLAHRADVVLKIESILISQLMLLGLFTLYRFRKKIDLPKIVKCGPASIGWDIGVGAAAWLVSFPAVRAVDGVFEILNLYAFDVGPPKQIAVEFMEQLLAYPKYLWIGIVITFVMAPILEEFVFRGCLQSYLRTKVSRLKAIIISSCVFGLAHFAPSQGLGNIPILAAIITFGLFLGWVYERQRSLFASIALHATFNGISIAVLLMRGAA